MFTAENAEKISLNLCELRASAVGSGAFSIALAYPLLTLI